MKSYSFAILLFALLIGVALAFIRPAQPVQLAAAKPVAGAGLDNPSITSDGNIHPARKCKWRGLLFIFFLKIPVSLTLSDH